MSFPFLRRLIAPVLVLCAASYASQAQMAVSPANAQVHAGTPFQFKATNNGQPVSGGFFWIGGTGDLGWASNAGVYYPPLTVPANPNITVTYYQNGVNTSVPATLVNPLPVINSVNVTAITQLSTPLVITGSGFLPTSQVTIQGVPVKTNYVGYQVLTATAAFSSAPSGPITVGVTNPNPGGSSTSVNITNGLTSTSITPAAATIPAGTTQQFAITINGKTPTDGYWYSRSPSNSDEGWIDAKGLFHGPYRMPASNTVIVGFYNGQTYETTATITNPIPKPVSVAPATLTQLSTPIQVTGSGFLPTSVISVAGQPMPTVYLNDNLLAATATLTKPINGPIPVSVTNPNPGTATSALSITGVFPDTTSIKPSTLTSGWVTINVSGSGYTGSTLLMLDGKPMKTTVNSATSITGVGYLPPWKSEKNATITTISQAGGPVFASATVPVTNAALSYDAAARFATQAALGPRPDVVEHIQSVGFQGFITEQMAQPGVTYNPSVLPRWNFLQAAVTGNSLLRQRMALALTSFIVNQSSYYEYQSYAPWEMKLEADAFGNFRQLMADMMSDAELTDFLTLPGNYANTTGTYHPNQNFAREFLQLFTVGLYKLNEDGSVQTDSTGAPVQTYDQSTILDLSRAFTGWNFGPVVNPQYTAGTIDYSQPLQGFDQYHDHGSKVLFGNVTLPAGQDINADRKATLDAVFAHPNVPPFVVTRLINALVESNPSPAYISRVVQVFKDNGSGVRGDLAAVVRAILLDPEARQGDAAPVAKTEGYLQDPLLRQLTTMNALQQTTWDGQPIYAPRLLGEDWWHPPSVFGFYPLQYNIPGINLNGPQFSLLNNQEIVNQSQLLYAMVSGTAIGFSPQYQQKSWLYTAFTNVPDLVDGLNHLLYHGQMPPATQSVITSYCSGISDQNQAFSDAIFLALNSDNVGLSH